MKRWPFSPSTIIASGCLSGLAPAAPGTVGSFVAALLFLVLSPMNSEFQMYSIIFATLVGTLATHLCLKASPETTDPGWIVIDEWVGVWITLWGCSGDLVATLTGFALFRIFDILKPPPVSWAERLPGAIGVMADDIVAGLLGLLMMHVLL